MVPIFGSTLQTPLSSMLRFGRWVACTSAMGTLHNVASLASVASKMLNGCNARVAFDGN